MEKAAVALGRTLGRGPRSAQGVGTGRGVSCLHVDGSAGLLVHGGHQPGQPVPQPVVPRPQLVHRLQQHPVS